MSRQHPRKLLSDDALSEQLSLYDMLSAMFCLPRELVLSDDDMKAIESIRSYLEAADSGPNRMENKTASHLPQKMSLMLRIRPSDAGSDPASSRSLELSIEIAFGCQTAHNDVTERPPLPQLRLRCPQWLDRKAYAQLLEDCEGILATPDEKESENAIDYVTRAVERLQEILPELIATSDDATTRGSSQASDVSTSSSDYTHVLRVWYWLPSLSTKSKRADLVSYAAEPTKDGRPPLSGFVLAGKPGIICLESSLVPPPAASSIASPAQPSEATLRAASSQIDTYWKRIKTESWSDIPPAHKKVSERLREPCIARAFGNASPADRPGVTGAKGMVEITGMLRAESAQGMRGHRGNRGDLAVLMRWMDGPDGEGGLPRGLGARLEKVLGAEWDAADE